MYPHSQACDRSIQKERYSGKSPDQELGEAGVSSSSLSCGVALGRYSASQDPGILICNIKV